MSDALLHIGLSGTFLKANVNWAERMDRLRKEMLQESRDAFQRSGYYQEWALTRDGKRATLSGVERTLESDSDEDSATVSAMNTIHQRGGMYKASDKQRRYLFATHPEWRSGKKELSGWDLLESLRGAGQGMTLRFPKRTYLEVTDRFIEFAGQVLGEQLFTAEVIVEQGE
jgi:hypothetical protein